MVRATAIVSGLLTMTAWGRQERRRPPQAARRLLTIGHHFDGSMDDLRLYDYMLTYQDLAKLLADGP
jgi:hypothetical protein